MLQWGKFGLQLKDTQVPYLHLDLKMKTTVKLLMEMKKAVLLSLTF